MAFTPDGRLLVTRQSGSLRVVTAAGATAQPFAVAVKFIDRANPETGGVASLDSSAFAVTVSIVPG